MTTLKRALVSSAFAAPSGWQAGAEAMREAAAIAACWWCWKGKPYEGLPADEAPRKTRDGNTYLYHRVDPGEFGFAECHATDIRALPLPEPPA